MIHRLTIFFGILILISFGYSSSQAREWVSRSGTFKMQATYIDADEQKVRLRKSDGKIISVLRSKLSAADQAYISSLKKEANRVGTDAPEKQLEKSQSILKNNGFTLTNAGATLADEQSFIKDMRRLSRLFRMVKKASKELAMQKKLQKDAKDAMSELTKQNIRLNSQFAGPFRNSQLVASINANQGKMSLLAEELKRIQNVVNEAQGELNDARTAYAQAILDLQKTGNDVLLQYKKLSANEAVRTAFRQMNQSNRTDYDVGPTKAFQKWFKKLKSLKDKVLSDSVQLRRSAGGTLNVTVVFNGKYTQEMILDSGASLISLPQNIADKCGIEIKADAPRIRLSIADGGTIMGRLVTIPNVRVGKFLAKDVECVVLDRSARNAPPLLGMSFLENFQFQINAQKETLTMVDVVTPDARGYEKKPR